jgi:DNA-binding NtrC family response regulator
MARDPIKILIVDDDERALIELEHLLESEGYSTVTAWGSQQALNLSDQAGFDLILIDERLIGIDSGGLLIELTGRHPGAFPLLMHGRKSEASRAPNTVCKWEPADMKAAIRNCLAA